MQRWYVIHTKPRQEGRAETHLGRQGYHCYLPKIKPRPGRRGRVLASEPLFPRYLFVQLDINRDNLASLCSTKGVSGLVRFGERLPTLPAGFIDGLRQATDPASGLIPLPEPAFLPGDAVMIEEGPLAGLQGVFKAVTGQERVIVLLDLLGKQNEVILPRRSIARAA